MPWTALLFLGLTVILWRFVHTHPSDISRFLGTLTAVVCLIAGLAHAPILLKSLILLAVLIQPAIQLRRSPS